VSDGEFGDDLTPEEEAARSDRTIIPADWSDLSRFVQSYRFPYWETEHEGRYLELVARGHTEDDSWALKDGHDCYNKRTRRWQYEMRPSERSEEFLRDCRMTLDEARQIVPQVVWKLNHHARRKVARIIRNYRQREAEREAAEARQKAQAEALRRAGGVWSQFARKTGENE
jgi:hypothetical protein